MKNFSTQISLSALMAVLLVSQISLNSCKKSTREEEEEKAVEVIIAPQGNQNEVVVASLWPSGNNTILQELPASYWTSDGSPVESRSYLKFDLSTIPAGKTITKAHLSLYAVPNPLNGNGISAHYGNENAVLIQRVSEPWTTSTLTWANQPASSTTHQVELQATTNAFKNYETIDITSLIQDMHKQGNYGMVLRLKNLAIYNIQNFASSKHPNQNLHPKLILEYSN